MSDTTVKTNNFEFKFSDSDVVDLEDVYYDGDYNPHNCRMWLLHDHGFVVAIVMASNLQDALDSAVDADKMERFLVSEDDLSDYENEEGLSFLGNASEPHDIETLGYVSFPLPKRSLTALYGETVKGIDYHV